MSDILTWKARVVREKRPIGDEEPNALYLDNDYESEFKITRKNATTGALEAATGLTVTIRWSATQSGSAIHANLTGPATERGTTALYARTWDGQTLRDHLAAAYLNTKIYEVLVSP